MSALISTLFETAGSRDRRLAAGTYLFHQGEPVESLFLVTGGEVQLIRHQAGGSAIVLQRAGPGNILAEASTFAACYHCDAIARSNATVRGIARSRFLRHFREEPDFALAWSAQLAREVQATRLRSEILSLRTVAERLDAWIAWHGALPPKGEWNQIALQIAVSPEALYREISTRKRSHGKE
ncbi:Crp/Fnr family transcriptional regulator [Roseibium sp.]|uniref:Crp/Fnr family transcriptional regulator n=1 Tax=Roseibium sp. TaxID=1936156 RepID=UPI003D09C0C7